MANRSVQARLTAARKQKQQDNAKRTLLIEYARELGAKNPETFANVTLASIIRGNNPELDRAAKMVEGLGEGGIEKLKYENTPQSAFLLALLGE